MTPTASKARLDLETDEGAIDAAYSLIFPVKPDYSNLKANTNINTRVLRTLCIRAKVPYSGTKEVMYNRLVRIVISQTCRHVNNFSSPQRALEKIPEVENRPRDEVARNPSTSAAAGNSAGQASGSRPPNAANRQQENHPTTQLPPSTGNADSQQPETTFVPLMGRSLLRRVSYDTARTITPEWFKAAPANMGQTKHGKLSSKEWRNAFTVNFLITLPREWGKDYSGVSSSPKHKILDNFVHLVLSILLSTQRTMTEDVIRLYELHIRAYLTSFRELYPTQTITPYQHLALGHFSDFLRSLGPWDNWNTGPPETYIGMSQKIPTNSRFGTQGVMFGNYDC